jgi:hypothetical protein
MADAMRSGAARTGISGHPRAVHSSLAAAGCRAIARSWLLAACCLGATCFSQSASAQTTDGPGPTPAKEANVKKPKAPKHPSVRIGKHLKLDFNARVESDLRLATPEIGLVRANQEWQDRRVGVEATAFKRIKFEVSRELGDDFEAAGTRTPMCGSRRSSASKPGASKFRSAMRSLPANPIWTSPTAHWPGVCSRRAATPASWSTAALAVAGWNIRPDISPATAITCAPPRLKADRTRWQRGSW